jgi:hypothetical protein
MTVMGRKAHYIVLNGKTPLLLIGTSNIRFIEPQRWPQYATQKITAYTIECAIDKVNNCGSDQKPAVTIFHSLTNDKNLL